MNQWKLEMDSNEGYEVNTDILESEANGLQLGRI